jgi:hypothetical protein
MPREGLQDSARGFNPGNSHPTARRPERAQIERRNNRDMACSDPIHLPKHWFRLSSLTRVCSFANKTYCYPPLSNRVGLAHLIFRPVRATRFWVRVPRVETLG